MQTTIYQNNTESFWDRIAPKYAKKPISDLEAYQEKLQQVRSLLHPTDRVLEIGCGTGGTALRLAPNVSWFTASDISRRMIEIAQSKLANGAPDNVSFYLAEATETINGQPFDSICAFSLLHLVDDIPQTLSIVRQQLKPGGLLLSKTVCLKEGPLPIRLFVRALTILGIAPKVLALSKDELIQHIMDAGFIIESTGHFGKQRINPFIVARRPAV